MNTQKDMNLQEYRAMINPATLEELRVDCRGMAMLNCEFPPARFNYSFGRITVRNPSPIAMEKLQMAATAMRANLILGDLD